MGNYYTHKLSAEKLKRCYDLAPERVQQYLRAEINFVCESIKESQTVLELGCGYGRVFPELLKRTIFVTGIDNSFSSLQYGKKLFSTNSNVKFFQMNASKTGFSDNAFDVVLCIQNGISAFKVDRKKLIAEAVRITRPGGKIFFSTYSEKFWDHRLEWFKIQSAHDLIGEIDYNQTGDGVIVCKDGFKAVTISAGEFDDLSTSLNLKSDITEVDRSSLFWIIYVD
ncbi:MAG: class I SAM-dependent methyltransferase [Ignavibacteria bacterium]